MTRSCYQKELELDLHGFLRSYISFKYERGQIIQYLKICFPCSKPRSEYIRQVAKNMLFVRKYYFSLWSD